MIHFEPLAYMQEVGSRMKEKFKNNRDEYFFNESSRKSEELLSAEARVKYDRVREQVAAMHSIVASMLQVHTCMCVYIHVLMGDEEEGRKKQARSNKQGKATQHTQGSHFS